MFRPADHDAELSEEQFRLLRDFIHERFGLYFENGQRASLRLRLAGRLATLGLLSFEDYYRYLRFGPRRAEELKHLASHLTNNETYFFRESLQLRVFAESILKGIREQKTARDDRTLRILSAGCSTGEEVMTLAMIVHDSGMFFWNWDVQIVGMDVDEAALEKARRGFYQQNSFRGVSPDLVERHFVRTSHGLQVKEAIRRPVSLRAGNILEAESFLDLRGLDAIFCRNVLIYFSDGAALRVVRHFHQALAPGGYLLLGHAESLSRITDMFTPIRFQGAMAYQKLREATP